MSELSVCALSFVSVVFVVTGSAKPRASSEQAERTAFSLVAGRLASARTIGRSLGGAELALVACWQAKGSGD